MLFTSCLCWSMVPRAPKVSCFFLEVPGQARCRPVASLRILGGERKGAPAAQPDVCPTLPDLHQLAKGARRAKPDPQHGLASMQRDLLHGWAVLGSLRV